MHVTQRSFFISMAQHQTTEASIRMSKARQVGGKSVTAAMGGLVFEICFFIGLLQKAGKLIFI